jgi:hypothetical protein
MASTLEDKLRPDNIPIYYSYKAFKWDQFFVGVFGALAIFGVLMKLWDDPFWGAVSPEVAQLMFEFFMPIGFLGECIVFIIMGFIKGERSVEVYPPKEMKEELAQMDSAALARQEPVTVNMELPDSLKTLIEEKLASEMDQKMRELTETLMIDVEKTQKLLHQTNQAYSGLNDMSTSFKDFSQRIQNIDNTLKAFETIDTGDLSENTAKMGEQLAAANKSIESFQTEVKRVSEKFKNF